MNKERLRLALRIDEHEKAVAKRIIQWFGAAIHAAIQHGLWILQTFPALIFGLYTGWFRARGLLAGWTVGFSGGTWMVWLNDFKPLHTLYFGGASSRFIPVC